MGDIFTIFKKFFLVILMPGIQQITLSIKVCMILCRNCERTCAATSEHIFYVEDCANASERNAADIFYVEAKAWLLLETFQCFLKNVRLLLKNYQKKPDAFEIY